MFICSCYPSEVLKGGERGAPFVPQEPADGCNPLQNAHWKSIKTGWTWCMSMEAGDTFSQGGAPAKKHKFGSKKRLWCFPAKKKKKYCKKRQREWIATPFNEGPLAAPPLELNTAAISSPYPGADIACRGYNHKKRSKHWHFSLRRLLRDIHCGRTRGNSPTSQRKTDGCYVGMITCSQWQYWSTWRCWEGIMFTMFTIVV